MKEFIWPKNQSFIKFLESKNISKNLYFNLSSSQKELCSELESEIIYEIIFNYNNTISQILIPINEELQIHISKINKKYIIDFIPIRYILKEYSINIKLKSSIYEDIINKTSNKLLFNQLIIAFNKSIDFKKMRKNDNIRIKYYQKIRNGKYFGKPTIKAAMVEVNKIKHYIYKNKNDDKYYNEKGISLSNFMIKTPLKYSRISDGFSYKRFHPIKKKYMGHLGIDYAAPIGRKVYAAASGKIIYKNTKGGYGKTIIIKHKDGYRTLYAHLNKYKYNLKIGQYVKQGQHIAYVGTTGLSTGPHLHFGLYKNKKAINPNKIITVKKSILTGNKKRKFLKYIKKISKEIETGLKNSIIPLKIENRQTKSKIVI
jgi:murein DD-endopeptidase MepM/ murein hydrolase activator NlpD